jgi:hypothetical protein
MSGRDAAIILDSTNSAAAAVFSTVNNMNKRFFLAAAGAYPRGRANLSFLFSKDWKKQKSVTGSSYWFSQKDSIALALGSNLALVSNKDPFESFPVEVPSRKFNAFNRGMVLAGWISEPSDTVNSFVSNLGIPLEIPAEEFFFGAERTAEPSAGARQDLPWVLVFGIRTASAAQARSLLSLFSLARFFVMAAPAAETGNDSPSANLLEMAALLFANTPEQDEDLLTLRTAPLDANGVALLFQMFSLYSQ